MKIWIDIDNAPHVLIMEPIIKELREAGHEVFVTARDYGQTIELLKIKNIDYKAVGRHPGKSKIKKISFLFFRMMELYFILFGKKIKVAFSHGSRSMVLPAKLHGIPVLIMYDYEYVADFLFREFGDKLIVPKLIVDKLIAKQDIKDKIISYDGLKEELYIWDHEYDGNWANGLCIDRSKILVVLRPPATMAHYHNPISEVIFYKIIENTKYRKDISVLLVPRTKEQVGEITKRIRDMGNICVLEHAVDGISMLKDADVIIGGGGTMNREAALLGKRVYSIFHGKKGSIDKWLEDNGYLSFINSEKDIDNIKFKKSIKEFQGKRNNLLAKQISRIVLENAKVYHENND
ncbi:MAG: DUF354 domain-containing protein [Proteobacteria bacterium]|nr:DUF354 domain-containing protein [Pseudomonadota bacterium]